MREHLGVEVAGHDDDGADVDVWMDGWDDVAREEREGERLNGGQGRVRGGVRGEGGCKSRRGDARAELGRRLVA